MTATTETTDITIVSGPTSPGTPLDWDRQHLAVEFTNWITAAGTSLGRTSHSPVPLVMT